MKKSIIFLVMLSLLGSCKKNTGTVKSEHTSSINLNKSDSLVLVKFHEEIGGLGWNLKDCSTWRGVTFMRDEKSGQSYVNSIRYECGEIRNNGGTITKEIGKLSKLTSFIIQDDAVLLNCVFPEEIFNCPLEVLRVEGEGISGEFTSAVSKIANTIQLFYIQGTAMSGQLPKEFGEFKNLVSILYLVGNHFSGHVPSTFSTIPKGVTLAFNDITSVDWAFFNVKESDFVHADLHQNKLQGLIPDDVINSAIWKKTYFSFGNQKSGYGFSNYSDIKSL